MLAIPIKKGKRQALVLIFGPENLERMEQGDPIDFDIKQSGITEAPLIMICYEKDMSKVNKFVNKRDIKGLMDYLSRGFEFRPEKGDHDRGPESIHESQ